MTRELIAQAEALDATFEKWWLEQQNDFRGFVTSKEACRVAWHTCSLQAQAEQPAEPVAWTRWTMPDLCRLYAYAYRAGHEDTCEATYTHVVEADVETYHEDSVVEYLCDHEKRTHPDPRIAALQRDLAAAQAEVEDRIAELQRTYEVIRSHAQLTFKAEDERDEARAEVQALRVDAERYQHIRLGLLYQGPRAIWFDFETGRWEPVSGEHLDRRTDQAIDAAIDQAKRGGE